MASLRHPLVVGAALTLLSAVVASLLIPSLTRVWQDRAKELALKQALVKNMSEQTTAAIIEARYFPADHPGASADVGGAAYTQAASKWQIAAASIGSELTTYFTSTDLSRQWQDFTEAVRIYIHQQTFLRAAPGSYDLIDLRKYFRGVHMNTPAYEKTRHDFTNGGADIGAGHTVLTLLAAQRDQLEREVIESHASGFSHGFWIFR